MTPSDGPRERLISTALRLFYEQGYQATGINQLIKEAGVAKASFYDHFKDKEALYVAFLERRHDNWNNALRARVSSEKNSADQIKALFYYLEEWMLSDMYRGCAFLNSTVEFPDPNSKVRNVVCWHKNSLRTYIKELLIAHFREQNLEEAEIDRLTDTVYVLVDGAIIVSQVYNAPWPIHRAAETVDKLLNL